MSPSLCRQCIMFCSMRNSPTLCYWVIEWLSHLKIPFSFIKTFSSIENTQVGDWHFNILFAIYHLSQASQAYQLLISYENIRIIVKYVQDLSLSPNTTLGSSQSLSSLSPYVMYSLNPLATETNNLSLPGPFQRPRRGSDGSIYNQLQFPSTSNHGSMKRKKRSQTTPDTTSSSLSQTPPSGEFRESEYQDNNVKIWSLEYVPRAFTTTKKTVKVWYDELDCCLISIITLDHSSS